MSGQVLVLAKAPVAGRVKTRLCPPCTPEQAALVAAAALADTLSIVDSTAARRRILVVDGELAAPPAWTRVEQRGRTLGERIAHALRTTRRAGTASLLIGMDTPQVTPSLLAGLWGPLDTADAVLAPAEDGGWWALAMRDPARADVLRDVPTSLPTTNQATAEALRGNGLRVAVGPRLCDVDTAVAAHAVAAQCPRWSRFAAAVAAHVRLPVTSGPVRP